MKNKLQIILLSTLITILIIFSVITGIFYLSSNNSDSLMSLKKILPNNFKGLIKEKVCKYEYFVPEFKNERIFPQTQFLQLKFREILVDNLDPTFAYYVNKKDGFIQQKKIKDVSVKSSFYIETNAEKTLLISIKGKIFLYKTSDFFKNKKKIKSFLIETNLPKDLYVDDTLIYKNKIYLSTRTNKKACDNRTIYSAELNYKKLKFINFFSQGSKGECFSGYFGGRIAIANTLGETSILLSNRYIGSKKQFPFLKNYNKKNELAVISININSKKVTPISAGHRNPQGLLVNNENVILSTEHGPRGGDEINKIIQGKNYGWPIASYGENYGSKPGTKNYKKSHADNGFEEPIYSFVPSIGISQLIEIPNDFSQQWQNNYFVTSLRNLSLYRVKFDQSFSKILTMEKIRVGKRIRDIAFNKSFNSFFLALENNTGSIGIINIKK